MNIYEYIKKEINNTDYGKDESVRDTISHLDDILTKYGNDKKVVELVSSFYEKLVTNQFYGGRINKVFTHKYKKMLFKLYNECGIDFYNEKSINSAIRISMQINSSINDMVAPDISPLYKCLRHLREFDVITKEEFRKLSRSNLDHSGIRNVVKTLENKENIYNYNASAYYNAAIKSYVNKIYDLYYMSDSNLVAMRRSKTKYLDDDTCKEIKSRNNELKALCYMKMNMIKNKG